MMPVSDDASLNKTICNPGEHNYCNIRARRSGVDRHVCNVKATGSNPVESMSRGSGRLRFPEVAVWSRDLPPGLQKRMSRVRIPPGFNRSNQGAVRGLFWKSGPFERFLPHTHAGTL